MVSIKSTTLVAVLLLLNCHWIQCQFYGGPGYGYGGYPIITDGYDNDGLDTILPLIILACAGRGGFGGCGGGYGGYGYGGGCGCGGGCGGCCGCGCGCGCCGGCGCGCGGCGCC